MDDLIPAQATPAATLEDYIRNPNFAKSEAEWWAHRRIAELENALAASDMSIAALEADNARLMGLVKEAGEAFLETREMLGLAEQAVHEECCPTTWKTADGQPHCKLHKEICAVLFRHEATRDNVRATLAKIKEATDGR